MSHKIGLALKASNNMSQMKAPPLSDSKHMEGISNTQERRKGIQTEGSMSQCPWCSQKTRQV